MIGRHAVMAIVVAGVIFAAGWFAGSELQPEYGQMQVPRNIYIAAVAGDDGPWPSCNDLRKAFQGAVLKGDKTVNLESVNRLDDNPGAWTYMDCKR